MKISISLLMLVAGVLGTFQSYAQSDATEAATKVAKEYAAALNFNNEQVDQAKKIFAVHLQDSRENWREADGDRDAFNVKQQETFKETDTRIKAMLNDEQLAAYKEKRDELKRKALDRYLGEFLEE